MKRKKVLIIGVVITVILLFTVGITYAAFNYNRTGTNNSQLVAGDIYMHFQETNQLTIENAMPYSVSYSYKHNSNMTEEEVNACVTYFETSDEFGPGFIEYLIANGESIETFCDGTGTADGLTFQQLLDEDVFPEEALTYFEENNIIKSPSPFANLAYFEFTIDGKNTYTEKDIWYEIVLSYGDSHTTRTERIRDDLLRFRLVEVINGEEEELVTNKSYDNLTNRRIWVDTIPKNTTNEVVHTYRLYMWISDSVRIGNTSDVDYDIETWNNEVYASIKVNVTGDFNEKELPFSDEFKKTVIANDTVTCPTYVEEDGITYISGTKDCIDFNYVWYSGKLWRITAIYPNGTMKMITDDNITTIAYGENVNFYIDDSNKSWIYQWLNEDFLDTLYNYENIIVTDASWNATQTSSVSTKPTETTLVTAPVGLLNSYEYYKSYQNAGYSNGYLNIGYFWWLLNPYNSSNVWQVFNNGDADGGDPKSNTSGARPSINLQSGITINGGTGTSDDPYTISGDKGTANTTFLNTRQSGEYVNFDGELYRIVGIENNTTKLNKMDYVRDESDAVIEKKFSSSTTFGSGDSDIYWDYYLNNTWYNSINETYKNMLVEETYYLGTVGSVRNYKSSICVTASNTITTTDCEKTSSIWTGYVGLPRYGEMFASQQGSSYSSSEYMWLITPYSSSNVWHVYNNGNANSRNASSNASGARPSINLSSAVKITGGTGLKNDPFEISL